MERGWREYTESTPIRDNWNLWWKTSAFSVSQHKQLKAWQVGDGLHFFRLKMFSLFLLLSLTLLLFPTYLDYFAAKRNIWLSSCNVISNSSTAAMTAMLFRLRPFKNLKWNGLLRSFPMESLKTRFSLLRHNSRIFCF